MDSEPAARAVYWEGAAEFFDGKQAKAHIAPVAIGPGGLEVRDGEAAGRYRRGDLEPIEICADGAFFSLGLKAHPGASLCFRGRPEALEWLRSAGLLPRPLGSGMSWKGKALALSAFLAAFCAFMYFAGLDLLVNAVVKALPPGIDQVIGSPAAKIFESRLKAPGDSAAARALAKSRNLVRALRPGYADSVRILIVADTSVKNAFAFPGGTIVVFTGMLHMLDSREEWMGLLAHEGGHLHLRHGTRRLVRSSLLGLGAALLFGDVSGAGSVLLDNAGTLMDLSYGRRDESEADAFALASLRAGGYSTAGLTRLLEKFLRFQELPGWAAFLSTHPATRDRLEALKGAQDADGAAAVPRGKLLSEAEWAALKRM